MQNVERTVAEIARLCQEHGLSVGAVESLTSGAVASALGQGEGASEWFRGAVVAYRTETKVSLLGLVPGTDPCSPSCAAQLAGGGRALLHADVCVSTTGVGGPDPVDGHPAGEVHIGVAGVEGIATTQHLFDEDPAEVVEETTATAVAAVLDALSAAVAAGQGGRDDQEPADDGIRILPITPDDAGEVLTVQRAAFVSEAQIYGSADTSPLTQTLEELAAELESADGWVARKAGRLVGAIRAREDGELLLIGRIAIAPDVQGEGIGRRLLAAAESASGAAEAELFTGSLSEANLRLYQSCGYEERERVDQGDGTAQIFMRKRLRG
jgi:PncC family amidohydrolase